MEDMSRERKISTYIFTVIFFSLNSYLLFNFNLIAKHNIEWQN